MKVLDASENLTEGYIRELPYLIHGSDPIIRDYTATEEHLAQVRKAKDEGRLPIFTLSPKMFCKRTPEKKEDLKREAQKKRGRRYSALYYLLDLKVVAQRDETLDITWNFGNRQVRLGEEPPTIRRAVTGEGFEEDLEKYLTEEPNGAGGCHKFHRRSSAGVPAKSLHSRSCRELF